MILELLILLMAHPNFNPYAIEASEQKLSSNIHAKH